MDVSTEALRKVKEALKAFKSDIEGIGTSAVLRNQSCIEECENNISKTAMVVKEFEDKVISITRAIEELDDRIVSMQNELQQIDKMLPRLEQQVQNLHLQLSQLSDQLAALQTQLADTEDNDRRQQIQSQINAVRSQMNGVRDSIQSTEQQIGESKDKKIRLKNGINECSSQKEEYENERSVTKRRLHRYQQKLERLNIANRNVQADFNSYVQSVRKFENNSVESAESKFKIVDECIDLIEEMESVM